MGCSPRGLKRVIEHTHTHTHTHTDWTLDITDSEMEHVPV